MTGPGSVPEGALARQTREKRMIVNGMEARFPLVMDSEGGTKITTSPQERAIPHDRRLHRPSQPGRS